MKPGPKEQQITELRKRKALPKLAAATAAATKKRLKSLGHIARLKAFQSGEASKLPAIGNAAVAIINQQEEKNMSKKKTAAKPRASAPRSSRGRRRRDTA